VGFLFRAIWLAALVAATYPIAVAGQLAFDTLFGDSLLWTEWLHGSRRTAAFALLDGWVSSIGWVLGFWAIAILLRAWSGALQRVELSALLLVCVGLVITILTRSVQVPLLLVLLFASAAALERFRMGVVRR
jgi:hypothetical protein